jgi:hypothetical protein
VGDKVGDSYIIMLLVYVVDLSLLALFLIWVKKVLTSNAKIRSKKHKRTIQKAFLFVTVPLFVIFMVSLALNTSGLQ